MHDRLIVGQSEPAQRRITLPVAQVGHLQQGARLRGRDPARRGGGIVGDGRLPGRGAPGVPEARLTADTAVWPTSRNLASYIRFLPRKRRRRRLLVTTNTELKAIAAAAIRGLRKPSAASGMARVL